MTHQKEASLDNLNEQQIIMLRLFKNPMLEADFVKIKQFAVALLAKQLDDIVEDPEDKRNVTAETYKEMAEDPFCSKSNLNDLSKTDYSKHFVQRAKVTRNKSLKYL